MPVARPISGHTDSEQAFQTAFGWLEECIKEHHNLCPPLVTASGPPMLPLRVVDVGLPDAKTIRLRETNNERGLYACLSHCWGGQQPIMTTRKGNKVFDFQQGIPWEDLPKTFQDAVLIARKFGIQYLWIDSLCIIQDDDEDWQTQAALMADIYQKAVMTFAASASPGPRYGLFRSADPNHMHRRFSEHPTDDGLGYIQKRKPLEHSAADLPLMHRGWVVQERLLSPRYLHFGKNELLWECMERQKCECGGLGFGELSRLTWLEPKHRFLPRSLELLKTRRGAIVTAWHSAVSDYSRKNLSFPEDIFPAISGIANCVMEATGWTYVAGLWRENLITDLVWTVKKPELMTRCETWRAPTFSWASVQPKSQGVSSVSYEMMRSFEQGIEEENARGCRTDIYAQVVGTGCTPLGRDSTGKLTAGYIVLSGLLIKATLHRAGEMKSWKIAPIQRNPLPQSIFLHDYDLDGENSKMRDGDSVFCLKLVGSSKVPAHSNAEYLMYLVLLKTGSGQDLPENMAIEGEFERLGLYRDSRGPDAVRLEEVSNESAIHRDVRVKVV